MIQVNNVYCIFANLKTKEQYLKCVCVQMQRMEESCFQGNIQENVLPCHTNQVPMEKYWRWVLTQRKCLNASTIPKQTPPQSKSYLEGTEGPLNQFILSCHVTCALLSLASDSYGKIHCTRERMD